jgi:DMSO/TMAO reductase YedYZ molybdopterin-dependent catalytic subunit
VTVDSPGTSPTGGPDEDGASDGAAAPEPADVVPSDVVTPDAATDGGATHADDGHFGFPERLWRSVAAHRPPGLPTTRAFRSPLRGPWLTSVFGFLLLISLPLVALTGLLDYIAYGPRLHQSIPGNVGFLHLPFFNWPTRPAWLFQVTEGLHVSLGLILVPVVLAKLWSVMPKLFTWPPLRSVAELLERLSLVMIVGGIVFEMATGILNIQYDYLFGFNFYTAHYFGAWVFMTGFVVHVALKFPTMVRSLRSRSLITELRTPLAATEPEPPDADGLVPTDPAPPTLSRRGALALVGGGSLLVAVLTVGQSIGGVAREAALLIPRGRSYGDGPNDFQVNKTAVAASIEPSTTGATWRLSLTGGEGEITLDRPTLMAMRQHTADLPIACVEGWSTTQRWTGVRLADLADLAGVPHPAKAHVQSLEGGGGFSEAWLQQNQVLDPDALLALCVNGVDLSPDHGFPARVIVPAVPGVHCTKWVRSIEFVR